MRAAEDFLACLSRRGFLDLWGGGFRVFGKAAICECILLCRVQEAGIVGNTPSTNQSMDSDGEKLSLDERASISLTAHRALGILAMSSDIWAIISKELAVLSRRKAVAT